MSGKRVAVAVGFIGKLPVAGMALYNLHYLAGLRELGYDVHYVERVNHPDECYDPRTSSFGDDASFGLEWLEENLEPLGGVSWSFIDRSNACLGSGWNALQSALEHADFVLTLADPTWFDELEACPRRAFVDGDPLFTQASMLDLASDTARAIQRYPTLFTYGTRLGEADCSIPDAGRRWIPTRPVVATGLWRQMAHADPAVPITTVMNWGAWGDVEVNGVSYGHKAREMERLLDFPACTQHRIVLAVGGDPPRERLAAHGWELADPLEVTGTFDAYRAFIDGSRADLGIAKHAYVASRSGWFSDRSTCYLASGRPVLHQDTGYTDWLDVDAGVLPFDDTASLVEAIERLDVDYERHARAARAIAEEHFEARDVLARMLDEAGFR